MNGARRTIASIALPSALALVSACYAPEARASTTPPGRDFRCPAGALGAGAQSRRSRAGTKLRILTTVAPITSIVANVAGDRAEVTGIIPEGQDSHTFEPKPSAAKAMAQADVIFVNGLKLEDPTKELAAANLKQGAQIVELGTLTLSPDQYIYDFSFPKDGGKPNPHLWTNPPMAACYARIAQSVLSRADPANAPTYMRNGDVRCMEIDRRSSIPCV